MLGMFTVAGTGLHVVRTLENNGKVPLQSTHWITIGASSFTRSLGQDDDAARFSVDRDQSDTAVLANCSRRI